MNASSPDLSDDASSRGGLAFLFTRADGLAPSRYSWLTFVLLPIVTAGALAFRLPQLSKRPLHNDEANQAVKTGDLLAVMSAGAYGFSMSSNYNARGRPAEVLVDGDKFSVIRKRETYDDLIAMEK